jgi:pyridoxal/pyridoxine/pyridoxamine kinase
MDVTSTQAVNAYLLQERQQRQTAPPQAVVESIKESVKQQDPTLGDQGALMVAGNIAARYIDVRV